VGFVRQNHLTCSPATLTTLSRFWKKPAEHLEVAEAICYDGTPCHSERNWAEQHGWLAREFKVTLAASQALLDRGVPFVISTVQPGNAHAQAVIGYDGFRESLLIRDPYLRNRWELVADKGLAAQAASGPRGLALVPADQAGLLQGLDLPEAELYDLHHQALLALDRYDRAAAQAACHGLQASAPGHRLTLQVQRAVAAYDANPSEMLAPIEKLLAQFPDDVNLQLARLACLRDLMPREDRLTQLRAACAKKASDPLLWRELAMELSRDGREHGLALHGLDRVLRFRPGDPIAVSIRADMAWAQGRFEEASELYRFAACLDDKNESYAVAWFNAARWLKQTAEVLGFLTRRFHTQGRRSSQPSRTLVWAHLQLDQTASAFAILEQALDMRPDDGPLKLFAAEHCAIGGQLDRAETLLAQAQGKATPGQWARAAAALAGRRGDLKQELTHWRRVLDAEPLAFDAFRAVAFLLAEIEGRAASLAFLRQACERFPCFAPLRELQVEWSREEGLAELEKVARALVAEDPENAWARRELAAALSSLGRFAEAHRQLDLAAPVEPNHPGLFNVRGSCLAQEGRLAEARVQFQETLRRSVDDLFALRELLRHCVTPADRRAALDFIRGELIRQTTFGQAIQGFAELARPYVSVEDMLDLLRQAHAARPDLWESWAALAAHLVVAKNHDEALQVATAATQRFPLVPRVWLELGRVQRARREPEAAIAALEKVREINPAWGFGMRELAGTLEALGRLRDALPVLEQAVARCAQDALNRGALASVLWKLGEKSAALTQLRETVLLEPGYDWAWDRLNEWSREVRDAGAPLRLAEELTQRRPGEARSWWLLARILDQDEQLDQRLAALDKALALNPRFVDAWQLRASTLVHAGRYQDALLACRPPAFGAEPPGEMLAAEAWVIARQGDLPRAIRQIRSVLADHPGIEWAWRELADWHSQRQEWSQAAEAAESLSRLLPLDPIPLGYAANVKLRQGDRAAAKADLQRAFDLDATYTYAGLQLFDLQVEDGELDEAKKTLHRMEGQVPKPTLLGREIELALAGNSCGELKPLLVQVCALPDDDPAAFQRLAGTLHRGDVLYTAERTVRGCLREAAVNPNAAALWVELRAARKRIRNSRTLLRLPADSELARRGFAAQFDAIARWHRQPGPSVLRPDKSDFRRLLRTARDRFRQDDFLWGKVGYVLTCWHRYREAAQWLDDWRQRRNVEPWMLDNLLLACQQTDHVSEAAAVIQAARALPRRRGELVRFDVFHAFEHACAGDPQPGEYLLGITLEDTLDPYEKNLLQMLRVAVEYAPATASPPFDPTRKDRLKSALGGTMRHRACRRVFREITRLISQRLGRAGPRLWGTWQLFLAGPLGR
jgi:tetratricopeptide (TPR) repeat protein